MKIFVKAKPRAKKEKVEKIDNTHFLIYTKAIPEKGKANEAIINLLANYFNISKSRIKIIFGQSSKQKIIEIDI